MIFLATAWLYQTRRGCPPRESDTPCILCSVCKACSVEWLVIAVLGLVKELFSAEDAIVFHGSNLMRVWYKPYSISLLLSMIFIFIAGFFGCKLWAINPTRRLVAKLSIERCLVWSIWQIFFNSSLTVSIISLLLSISLSERFINEFFMFFLIFVTKCMSSANNCSKRLMYPLSVKNFPNSSNGYCSGSIT